MFASAATGKRGLARLVGLEQELAGANERNFALVQAISRLRRQLHDIRTGDAALERLARRRLSLVRDGETLYQLEPRAGVANRPTGAAPPGNAATHAAPGARHGERAP